MSKQKIPKTNAMRMLDRSKIDYEVTTYAWKEDTLDAKHVAQELGRKQEEIFKTIVAVGNKTGLIVAVLPSDKNIDLKKLALASKNKSVELLPLSDLEKNTGYIRGGCSPIGMKRCFPTYVAKQINDLKQVYVSAGQRGVQIVLAPKDLATVTKAVLVDILMEEV